jgi:tyrosine decarboxylase/aspartate 1-decarboxylase
MWIAKQITGKKEIIIPESAHFSFQKIASLMDMKLVTVPLNKKFVSNPSDIEKKLSKDTAAVVGVAGSTELGAIDPIPQINEVCKDNNIFLHIDAAFGGFVIPFLKKLNYDVPDFDFKLKGVSTISIDSHKMGHAAIPLGTLVIRDKAWIEEISVKSHCIDSEIQTGILGTRSGGPVAAGYAVTKYLGEDGYKKLVKNCMDLTHYTVKRLNEIGLPPIIEPTMNVIGIKIKNIEKIVKKLSKHGWKVNKIDHLSCIRIVLMPQITKQIIDEFIPVLLKSCKEVGEL